MPRKPGKLNAWFRLLRLPNLFTVPGDPLAGLLLAAPFTAHWIDAAACMFASLCLYASGLISNDCFDAEEDRKERPHRPLPAGHIRKTHAMTAAALLNLLAFFAAATAGNAPLWVATTLAVLVLLHNWRLKRIAQIGPASMGLCRALSLTLGAAAPGADALTDPAVLAAAATLGLYITAVTRIAARETQPVAQGPGRWAPALALGIGLGVTGFAAPHQDPAAFLTGIALAVVAAGWAWMRGRALAGTPPPATAQAEVGRLIQGLLPMQAALIAWSGALPSWSPALALLLLWPAVSVLARRFYSS